MKRLSMYLCLLFFLAILVNACQSAKPTSVPAAPTAPSSTAAPQTQPPGQAAAQLASGTALAAANCTCHTVAFAVKTLSKYNTGQGLFDKISKTMPKSNPGSLSTQQYYDVAAYILSQAGLLKPDQVADAQTLGGIKISP